MTAGPGEAIRVVTRKWDGRLHWHFRLERLHEDGHGVWLAGRPGTALQRGDEPAKTERDGFAMLIPRGAPWTAIFNAEDDPEIYVDVNTEPVWSDGEVTFVDLDLDVVRRRDGTVAVLDEDEFEEHRRLFGYPQDVVERAEATAAELVAALTLGEEPFAPDGVASALLGRLAASGHLSLQGPS